jgi:serine/threonine-protein kinase
VSENIKPGTVIADRYRVVRQLGRGGMGSVFLVEHVHTDEQLALKILHAAVIADAVALERFRREARTPARINSDHVVRVTDADIATELHGAPFLVMEYLRGEDLDQRIERMGPLPPVEVVLYLRQAARALDKAHALGIVHRDLKPENLFLTQREDGTPCIKILDFGIAKITGEASRELVRAQATTTGQIFGTPLFMSPEQAKGESSKICPQTDVWALGLIAHRLLTGRDIWTAETITHLIAQIAYEPMPIPSEHGAPFGRTYDQWFSVCCNRDVKQRYASAGEAVTALAKSLGIAEAISGPGGPDRITGRFVVDLPTPNPSTVGAVTLSASQLDLLGELPPAAPAPLANQTLALPPQPRTPEPPQARTPDSQPLRMSAGPLTLTGLKLGQAPRATRMRRLAVAGAIALVLGGLAFWWSQLPTTSAVSDAATATNAAANGGMGQAPPVVTQSAAPLVTADAGAPDAAAGKPSVKTPVTTKVPVTGTTSTKKKAYDPLSGRH